MVSKSLVLLFGSLTDPRNDIVVLDGSSSPLLCEVMVPSGLELNALIPLSVVHPSNNSKVRNLGFINGLLFVINFIT